MGQIFDFSFAPEVAQQQGFQSLLVILPFSVLRVHLSLQVTFCSSAFHKLEAEGARAAGKLVDSCLGFLLVTSQVIQ